MKEINLATAMKIKSRKLREMNNSISKLSRENYKEESEYKGDEELEVVHIRVKTLMEEIIDLKTKIAAANVASGVTGLIIKMNELKAFKKVITSIARDGGTETNRAFGSGDTFTVKYVSYIDTDCRDVIVKDLDNEIDSIQDRIDTLNATTYIKI